MLLLAVEWTLPGESLYHDPKQCESGIDVLFRWTVAGNSRLLECAAGGYGWRAVSHATSDAPQNKQPQQERPCGRCHYLPRSRKSPPHSNARPAPESLQLPFVTLCPQRMLRHSPSGTANWMVFRPLDWRVMLVIDSLTFLRCGMETWTLPRWLRGVPIALANFAIRLCASSLDSRTCVK
jgi:hypothetical protein